MPKKLKLAIPLLVLGVVLLIIGIFTALDTDPQKLMRMYGAEDGARRAESRHLGATLFIVFGGLSAVIGSGLFFMGLNEKKTKDREG